MGEDFVLRAQLMTDLSTRMSASKGAYWTIAFLLTPTGLVLYLIYFMSMSIDTPAFPFDRLVTFQGFDHKRRAEISWRLRQYRYDGEVLGPALRTFSIAPLWLSVGHILMAW
jgi:hypothetical protein